MIVNCVAYRGGKSLGNVPVDDISEILKDRGTFVWLGMHEPDTQLLRKMQEEFSLHDLAIEDALHAHQRPEAGGLRGLAVHRRRDGAAGEPRGAVRRNPPVRGPELHHHHPPRLVGQLRPGPPQVRDLAHPAGPGPRLRTVFRHRLHRGQLPAGCRAAAGPIPGTRGGDLPEVLRPGFDRAALQAEGRADQAAGRRRARSTTSARS